MEFEQDDNHIRIGHFKHAMAIDLSTRVQTRIVAVALTVTGFLVGAVVVTLAAQTLIALGVPVARNPGIQLALSTVMLQGVAFGLVALGYLKLRQLGDDFLGVRIPSLRDLGWTVGGFVLFFALFGVLNVVITVLGLPTAQNRITEVASRDPTVFLLLVPLSILLVGPGEELLFRGMVQGVLRKGFGAVVAIVLASVIFAVSHAGSLQGQGKFTYMAVVFVLALVLGATYERTGNLVVPALIHGSYNAVLFGIQYAAAIGAIPATFAIPTALALPLW